MESRRPRLFLDASVLFAATVSPRGGSAAVIELARAKRVTLALTKTIVQETQLNLERKADSKAVGLFLRFALAFKATIAPAPTQRALRRYDRLISDRNDRHVLAGAATSRSSVLLTLDRRHFMTDTLRRAKLPFRIQTPGKFLTAWREQHTAP